MKKARSTPNFNTSDRTVMKHFTGRMLSADMKNKSTDKRATRQTIAIPVGA